MERAVPRGLRLQQRGLLDLLRQRDALRRRSAVILVPIMVAVVLGGLGFPVLHELRRKPRRPARWSVHTKITLLGTGLLLVGGLVAVLVFEWSNPDDAGPARPGPASCSTPRSIPS